MIYQRNASFAAFVLVVCFAGVYYLTTSIREMVTPLIWSAFFAIPLTELILIADKFILTYTSFVLDKVCESRTVHRRADTIDFCAAFGDTHIKVGSGSGLSSFLEGLNPPASCKIRKLRNCLRRRVRVVRLEVDGQDSDVLGQPVNRLVEGWLYYVKEVTVREMTLTHADEAALPMTASIDGRAAEPQLRLQLFLDQADQYPAVLPGTQANRNIQLVGTLQVDKASSISWIVAFILSVAFMSGCCFVFVTCLIVGVQSFIDSIEDYKTGVNEFISYVKPLLTPEALDWLKTHAESFISNAMPALAAAMASAFESILFQTFMFVIYISFWIFEPLPISGPVARLFRSYLLLKTLVCLLFAGLMSVLLMCLKCRLWSFFFVLTFMLNFIPEIGALTVAFLMVPAVLFDGHLPMDTRLLNLLWLVIFGCLIKIITGNVVEVRMYATRGGQFMRMHPVIIMALIMLYYELLGVTGMFIAVPTVAAVKYYLLAFETPDTILNPLLVAIEGDEAAPHKNFVDTHRFDRIVCGGAREAVEPLLVQLNNGVELAGSRLPENLGDV